MSFDLTRPIKGLGPADSISISVATAIGVTAIYGMDIGPVADVHMTVPGDVSTNAAIKKAGCKAWALVALITLFTRDLNVAIIGGSMVVAEHVMYLHAEMSNPGNGQIEPKAGAYQPATPAVAANLSVVA